jgi:RNA polymerase sigma factor (sigma-70 family)
LEQIAIGVLPPGHSLDAASAEDLVQQTVVKLLESPKGLAQLDPALSPEAYLQTALRNTARDLARRKVLALKALKLLARERGVIGQQEPKTNNRLLKLAEKFDSLSEEQQILLRMRFWEGLSLGEIAKRRGESYSAVAVRVFRLLEKLRAGLRL